VKSISIIAALLFACFAYNHLWALWDEMPKWYNVLVVIPVVPMVLIGGLIGRRIGGSSRVGVAELSS
jgi:hypothetical protein